MTEPVVASYCTTFLKREMQHIYRQITGLRTVKTFVLTKSHDNADLFPFSEIEILPRPRINFLARFHKKYIRRMEPVFYRGEYDQLSGTLKKHHADLLHVYFGHTGVHLLPFIRNWPRPSVVSFHGMDIMERHSEPGYNNRLRDLLKTLPMVLARSESLADRLVELGCPRSKIRINRTGIPMHLFPEVSREIPSNGAWKVVQACRFIEKKGLPDTLLAFAEFHRQFPASRLTLAGEGPLEVSLRRRAGELGIPVDFPGFLQGDRLADLYNQSHIFIHPSITTGAGDREGVPNAMLEAMATGLPVVATRHGGIPEAVEENVDGLLVPEHAPDALTNALVTLASDRYPGMSSAAARNVRTKFEQSRSISALEGHYRELIDSTTDTRRKAE
ncbi:MAG: hypothetical protein Fur0032_16510 [Terrimicrobiaceae bacterium]